MAIMDLSKDPNLQITKPKFGDLNLKKDLSSQWADWKHSTAKVRDVYAAIKTKMNNAGIDERSKKAFMHSIQSFTGDNLTKVVRDNVAGMTSATFTGAIINEGVRRYLSRHSDIDTNVDENGHLPWEV